MQHRTNDTESCVSTLKAVAKPVVKDYKSKARTAIVGKGAWGNARERSLLSTAMHMGKLRKKRVEIERQQDMS